MQKMVVLKPGAQQAGELDLCLSDIPTSGLPVPIVIGIRSFGLSDFPTLPTPPTKLLSANKTNIIAF